MGTKTVPARPSELIILAINNLEEKEGSSSKDIVNFISEEFEMKPEEVTPRVQEALKRAITYGIISQKNGKYKIQDIPKQSEEGTSQQESPKGKRRTAPRKTTARKRKQASKPRRGTKKVCTRCQSKKKSSDDQ